MSRSKIEWTGATLNVATGCTKVSAGCINCYAERIALGYKSRKLLYWQRGFQLTLRPNQIEKPLKIKKPTLFFVCSMSDLFHRSIPDDYLARVFAMIRETPQHTYQILTKRPRRMLKYTQRLAAEDAGMMEKCAYETTKGLDWRRVSLPS